VLIVGARAREGSKVARWLSRAALLGFLCFCVAYYHLCRSLFVVMGYGFLVGFLPGFPLAALAARKLSTRQGVLRDLSWAALSFSLYFWASALFTVWRTQP
jgi:hypothetical protein